MDAEVLAQWNKLQPAGLVKVHAVPEIDYYDDSYIDDWDLPEEEKQEEKEKIAARIEREGHWIYSTMYRVSEQDTWKVADNIGGFIGRDFFGSGYDIDLYCAAITALDLAYQEEADEIAKTATYVGG
jgi:hypothetical protein